MTPDLIIVDATDAYLRTTFARRDSIVGKYFFEVFPNNPSTPDLDSAQNFKLSLEYAVEHLQPHHMPVLRYDLPRPASLGGGFEERYWQPSNTPVMDEAGKLLYILHEARDITQNVIANQEDHRRQERLSMLNSAVKAVSWEYDILNNRMYWGNSLQEVFGYEPEEMGPGGESWDSRVHPDDFLKVQESIKQANDAGCKIWTGEYRFMRADGTYAYVLDQGYTVYGSDGNPIRTTGSIIDMSKSKQPEDDLKENQNRFRHLLETLPHMAWAAEPNGKVLFFNNHWHSYTGMPEDQTEGWANYLHPEDAIYVLTAWNNAVASKTPFETEYRIRNHYDGTYRLFMERGVPMYDEQGNVKLWIGTFTDVEDQRQSLEKLRMKDQHLENILHHSPAHICLLQGPDHICKYVTPGIYQLFGSRQYLGKSALEVWPELQEQGLRELLDQVYQQGNVVRINGLKALIDRNQSGLSQEAYFHFKCQPLLDNNGNTEGVLISAIEVTELVQAKREAESLVQALMEKDLV